MRTVSLTIARREFSRLIEEVERGESVLITRRGRPLAELTPHRVGRSADPGWPAAYERMMAQLEDGASLGGLKIRREALYDG